MSWKQNVRVATKGLRGWVAVADGADKEVIVGIGTTVENGFAGVPDQAETLLQLVEGVLQVLQALYQQTIDDPSGAMSVLARALEVTEKYLDEQADETALDQAVADVRAQLGDTGDDHSATADARDADAIAGADAPPGVDQPTVADSQAADAQPADEPFTPTDVVEGPFDELSGRLVCLESDDSAGLGGVGVELAGLLTSGRIAPDAVALAAEAIEKINAAATGAGDRQALIAEAGRALEEAARAHKNAMELADTPVDQAGADPGESAGSESTASESAPGEPVAAPAVDEPAADTEAPVADEPAPEPAAADEPVDDEPAAADPGGQPDAETPAASAKPAEADMSCFDGPAVLPADADIDLLREFITECLDHITMAEGALLDLESNPEDADQINVIFRAFHTIKGTSGFLGLDRIQRLAHLAETMLDRGRDGEIKITGGYSDLALQSCDHLRTMIEALEGVSPGMELTVPETIGALLVNLADPEANGFSEAGSGDDAPMRVGDILVGTGAAERDQIEQAASAGSPDQKIGQKVVAAKAAKPADVAKALRTQKQAAAGAAAGGGGVKTEASVRVTTGRLDQLIDMVGELVISHSMIAQDGLVTSGENARLSRNVSHSGKIVRELQDLTMSLRMVPLKSTFQKMARLVRDVGKKAGKQIQFITEGEDTEIDRNMVESLNDPLVHMMRNSCDHGVENAEDRVAAGKDATGTVKLRAYHAAGNVVIEICDDGKGLDRDKILAKAMERGLVDSAKDMSDNDIYMLIFQPGFSTAEKVTDVSGRGVGMDVVRKNIEGLRGRIEVQSTLGEGTTFTIRLPLTMAITDAMLLRVGQQRYLLPTVSIEQSFRPEDGSVSTVVGQGEMVLLRGELLPVFRLHELYDVPNAITDIYDALLVVIEGEGRRCAIVVDELLAQQQVVIKSLGTMFGHVQGISGGAILGDGRVGLILDATGIQHLATGKKAGAGDNVAA